MSSLRRQTSQKLLQELFLCQNQVMMVTNCSTASSAALLLLFRCIILMQNVVTFYQRKCKATSKYITLLRACVTPASLRI